MSLSWILIVRTQMMTRLSVIGLILLMVLSSCEILGPDENALVQDNEEYSVVTDVLEYEAIVYRDSPKWIQIEIPSTFTNKLSYPVYFTGCRPPVTGTIQMQRGAGWDTIYWPLHQLCLSNPVMVLPGDSLVLPALMGACFPDNNCGPEFYGATEGTYRLNHFIYADPEGATLIPEAHRISNAFEMRIVEK